MSRHGRTGSTVAPDPGCATTTGSLPETIGGVRYPAGKDTASGHEDHPTVGATSRRCGSVVPQNRRWAGRTDDPRRHSAPVGRRRDHPVRMATARPPDDPFARLSRPFNRAVHRRIPSTAATVRFIVGPSATSPAGQSTVDRDRSTTSRTAVTAPQRSSPRAARASIARTAAAARAARSASILPSEPANAVPSCAVWANRAISSPGHGAGCGRLLAKGQRTGHRPAPVRQSGPGWTLPR